MINDSLEVLPQVLRAYARCQRFSCSAQLTRKIRTASATDSRFKMTLTYAKPRKLFLQWWLDDSPGSKQHTLITVDEIVVRYSWSDSVWQRDATIGDALASYAGVSSGIALHVPSLLVGYEDYSLFERIDRVAKHADETALTYELSGVARGGIERLVEVRADDGVITRMVERFSINDGAVECESQYNDIEMT